MIIIVTSADEVLQLAGKREPEPPATFRGEIQQALDNLADEVAAGKQGDADEV